MDYKLLLEIYYYGIILKMETPSPQPRQRAGRHEALSLRKEAEAALQPFHDTLLTEAPDAFDGLVAFSIDQWHERSASAVATVQPESDDRDRFTFYRDNIAFNRIDLSATAFGTAMAMPESAYLRSVMNPDHHTTYAPRIIIDNKVAGGIQAAFQTDKKMIPEQQLEKIWKHYAPVTQEVLAAFDQLAKRLAIRSIGDTLELLAPTTPNAFIISWDMSGSTELALSPRGYGTLRNYLLDVKAIFNTHTARYKGDYHDNGDGQDMIVWLPDGINRSDPTSVKQFGNSTVLPLLETIKDSHDTLVSQDYQDLNPKVRFIVGLGHVEKNHFEGKTSRELWQIDQALEQTPLGGTGFTKTAQAVLDIVQKQ